eukprot:1137663-Pelagomonas_calceolata.AAC.4
MKGVQGNFSNESIIMKSISFHDCYHNLMGKQTRTKQKRQTAALDTLPLRELQREMEQDRAAAAQQQQAASLWQACLLTCGSRGGKLQKIGSACEGIHF